MKKVFYLLLLFIIGVTVVKAQDTKNSKKYVGGNVFPVAKFSLVDTILYKAVPLRKFIEQSTISVEIPNALNSKDNQDIYRMPIITLYGGDSAPMPGTENMDRYRLKDSVGDEPILKNNIIKVYLKK